jgi:predicted extracellular nuclease
MVRNILPGIFILLLSITASAQKNLWCAFYNQENLFDTLDDPHKNDNVFLPQGKNSWNTQKYRQKIDHMARVIASMNNGKGADLLGMCEVENDLVLNDLTRDPQLLPMRYKFVHIEGPDERSIDNALIYQSNKLSLVSAIAYPVVFPQNPLSKTRDILLVKLKDKETKAEIVILVNHFPSKLGGEQKSEPKRIYAAKTVRHIYDSISSANPSLPVIIMGDFNDTPSDSSIAGTLNAKRKTEELSRQDLFNPMFALQQQQVGSHYYRNKWFMLDQIILSNNMISCTGKVCYQPLSAAVYKQNWMLDLQKGIPLRTFQGPKYMNGFSDHLPVYIILELTK